MVDGWGFSLGLGNRITRDYAVAERPISSKCYATSLRLVRGWSGCGALLESALMVTSRQALFSDASLRVLAIVLTAANMRAWPLPSRPFTRVAEQRRGALSRSSGVWPPRRMPRPPGTSCSHTRANETPSRYRCHLHACRRAMSCWPRCLRRSTLTCRAAARPALVRSGCGINCLDVQL